MVTRPIETRICRREDCRQPFDVPRGSRRIYHDLKCTRIIRDRRKYQRKKAEKQQVRDLGKLCKCGCGKPVTGRRITKEYHAPACKQRYYREQGQGAINKILAQRQFIIPKEPPKPVVLPSATEVFLMLARECIIQDTVMIYEAPGVAAR